MSLLGRIRTSAKSLEVDPADNEIAVPGALSPITFASAFSCQLASQSWVLEEVALKF